MQENKLQVGYDSIDGFLPLASIDGGGSGRRGQVGEGGPTQAVVGDILGQQVHRHIPAARRAQWPSSGHRYRSPRAALLPALLHNPKPTIDYRKPSISCYFKEMLSLISRYIVFVTASIIFEARFVQSCIRGLSYVLFFNYDTTNDIN